MDMEKVIKGLECCHNKNMLWQHDQCPYHGFDEDCESNLHADALALLKEQEAKQEAKPMIENEIGWHCPSCGMELIGKSASGYPCDLIDLPEDEPIHFCPKCGQAVKWL